MMVEYQKNKFVDIAQIEVAQIWEDETKYNINIYLRSGNSISIEDFNSEEEAREFLLARFGIS